MHTERFLHDALQILHVVEIACGHRATTISAQHLQDLREQLSLCLGIARDLPQTEGDSACGGVVSLEHEGVHLLADLIIAQWTSIDAGLQQHIEQCHATLLAQVILLLGVLLLPLLLLQHSATLLDHLDGELVHSAYELHLAQLEPGMRQRKEQLALQVDGHEAPGHQRSASGQGIREHF